MQRKTLPLSSGQFKVDAAKGMFEGYASRFDGIDSYGDTILPGAYAETLATHGVPKMFFNHDMWGVPIGKWMKAEEDKDGLFVAGKFTDGNQTANEVRAALLDGTVDGLSIGFALKAGDYSANPDNEYGRVISKVSRLFEVSVVTFPADEDARIDLDSIKSAVDAFESIADLEAFFRDVCGLSRKAAKHLIARSRSLPGLRDAERDGDEESAREAAIQLMIRGRALGMSIDHRS